MKKKYRNAVFMLYLAAILLTASIRMFGIVDIDSAYTIGKYANFFTLLLFIPVLNLKIRKVYFVFLLLFIFFAFIPSTSNIDTFSRYVVFSMNLLAFSSIIDQSFLSRKQLKLYIGIIKMFLLFSIIYIIVGYINEYGFLFFLNPFLDDIVLSQVGQIQHNHIGSIFLMYIGFLVMSTELDGKKRLGLSVLFILLSLALVSRQLYVFILVCSVFYYAFTPNKTKFYRYTFLFLISLLFFIFAYSYVKTHQIDWDLLNTFSSQRLFYYENALYQIRENTFGVGLFNWDYIPGTSERNFHSSILTISLGFGLVAMLSYFSLIIILAFSPKKNLTSKRKVLLQSMIISFIVVSMLENFIIGESDYRSLLIMLFIEFSYMTISNNNSVNHSKCINKLKEENII
jgi:hypothetical protein